MYAQVSTAQNLEEVRRRFGNREAAVGELRAHLAAFLLLASCWLARELLLSSLGA